MPPLGTMLLPKALTVSKTASDLDTGTQVTRFFVLHIDATHTPLVALSMARDPSLANRTQKFSRWMAVFAARPPS